MFLKASVEHEVFGKIDSTSTINLLYSIKTDGELKSLIIRNLAIVKWKRYLLKKRIIPELEILTNSFDSD